MKIIIAGGRDVDDYAMVEYVVEAVLTLSGLKATEVVCGGARGADSLGERWAEENGIPVKKFEADWTDIYAPGALPKKNPNGPGFYNARAGLDRNIKMAKYADALIAFWDGESRGTKHMIDEAKKMNLKVFICSV